LAERGASVVGYDKAPQKIAEAQAHEDARRLDVTFVIATPYTFLDDTTFDAATSVLVLQYATSPEELAAFFRSASRHLVSGGRFISDPRCPARDRRPRLGAIGPGIQQWRNIAASFEPAFSKQRVTFTASVRVVRAAKPGEIWTISKA
jgi:2-polyprenyl-3-methyl-5-hydroxy-6-metoxy-1,4-benzoquinol methylase